MEPVEYIAIRAVGYHTSKSVEDQGAGVVVCTLELTVPADTPQPIEPQVSQELRDARFLALPPAHFSKPSCFVQIPSGHELQRLEATSRAGAQVCPIHSALSLCRILAAPAPVPHPTRK